MLDDRAPHHLLSGQDPRMTYTHVTTPTRFLEASGIRFAYRRFGRDTGVPLICMPHFRAGMDHWDPAVTDGLAARRTVILFDNAGVSGSSGETPNTIEAMADCAGDFMDALGFPQMDVLGFSIGGYIAQELARRRPTLVRRLLLADTGPRGGEMSNDPHYLEYGASTDPQTGETGFEAFMYLLFASSAKSQAAGK